MLLKFIEETLYITVSLDLLIKGDSINVRFFRTNVINIFSFYLLI